MNRTRIIHWYNGGWEISFLKTCYDCDQMSKRLSKQRFKTLPTFFKHIAKPAPLWFWAPPFSTRCSWRSKKPCAKQHLWFTNHSHGDFAFGTSPVFVPDKRSANFLREDVEKLGPSQRLETPTIGIIIGTSENPFPLKAPSFAANNMEPKIQNPIPKHSMYSSFLW